MVKRYDRYEIEIIVSLGILILFLISTNFVSGYSSGRAIQGQQKQFEKSVNLSAYPKGIYILKTEESNHKIVFK